MTHRLVAATGGSTNAVLHLLAVAHEAGVELNIRDFDRISAATPLIADLKPGGQYVAVDLYEAGGIGVVVKRLLEGGLMDGSTLTVTGLTLAEETAKVEEAPGQKVVRPLDDPCKPTGGLVILHGRLWRVARYADITDLHAGARAYALTRGLFELVA